MLRFVLPLIADRLAAGQTSFTPADAARAARNARWNRTRLAHLTVEIVTPWVGTLQDYRRIYPPTWRLVGRPGYEGY